MSPRCFGSYIVQSHEARRKHLEIFSSSMQILKPITYHISRRNKFRFSKKTFQLKLRLFVLTGKKPYSNRNSGPNCIFCHPPTFARTFQRSFWRSSVIRVRCLVSLRSMWCSFFLFLTVFPQPFTGQKDTPSPHSIE